MIGALAVHRVGGRRARPRSWLLASNRRSVVYLWPALCTRRAGHDELHGESFALLEGGWMLLVVCTVKAAGCWAARRPPRARHPPAVAATARRDQGRPCASGARADRFIRTGASRAGRGAAPTGGPDLHEALGAPGEPVRRGDAMVPPTARCEQARLRHRQGPVGAGRGIHAARVAGSQGGHDVVGRPVIQAWGATGRAGTRDCAGASCRSTAGRPQESAAIAADQTQHGLDVLRDRPADGDAIGGVAVQPIAGAQVQRVQEPRNHNRVANSDPPPPVTPSIIRRSPSASRG